MARSLDELDRRIVGALQVDGRASWRRIAGVLGESFSTVTRRGNALLESGLVRVAAMDNVTKSVVVHLRCAPSALESVAEHWREDADVIFALVLTAPASVVLEVHERNGGGAAQLLRRLAGLEGVDDVSVSPVLRYHRTLGQWRPGLVTEREVRELGGGAAVPIGVAVEDRTTDERSVTDVLVADGRLTAAQIGARLGFAEPKVRKIITDLLDRELIDIRAVVAPDVLGLHLETWMSVDAPAADVERVAAELSVNPAVRYAVSVAGERPLLVHAAFVDGDRLSEFLGSSIFSGGVKVSTSAVAWAVRRGGVSVTG